ncbi:MAG TPA: carboxypeptidase regulatory-like domain-containing protein, partial [Longimicrobiaceae bacterium]|nr:carboxypeptidase regulatory-like domain-containing protein [Longimicrobiaceae bacterium]
AVDLQVTDGDTGAPLAGATVRLDGVPRAVSDTLGHVLIAGLTPGRHLMDVMMLGRRPVSPEIEVAGGEVLALEVVLDYDAVQLDPVEVTAPRRHAGGGAAYRGSGRWFGRDEILGTGARKLSELLVIVGAIQPNGRMRQARCAPRIIADGILISGGNLDLFPVQDIEAVQVFTNGSVPPEYGGTMSGCGVVVVWTRHK